VIQFLLNYKINISS